MERNFKCPQQLNKTREKNEKEKHDKKEKKII